MVFDLSSWKQSFEIVSQELELARRKKQALDDLLSTGRVSRPTYEHLEKGLTGTMRDLETQLRSHAERMTDRAEELEKQTQLLELLLAKLEIHHAAEEIDDGTYGKQRDAVELGLAATKNELNQIRNSLMKVAAKPA